MCVRVLCITIMFLSGEDEQDWLERQRTADEDLFRERVAHLRACQPVRDAMLAANPVMAARVYKCRMDALLSKVLQGKDRPIGELMDWWIRIEFQVCTVTNDLDFRTHAHTHTRTTTTLIVTA